MSFSSLDHVVYYDPTTGWGANEEWKLATAADGVRVFRTSARSKDGRYLYLADADARIYCYDSHADSLKRLGQCSTSDADYQMKNGRMRFRAMNLSADGRRIYFINDEAKTSGLWQWTVATGATELIVNLGELDERLGQARFDVHAGNDTWCEDGRMFACAYGSDEQRLPGVLFFGFDPEALRRRRWPER